MTVVDEIDRQILLESDRRIDEMRARQEIALGVGLARPQATKYTYAGKQKEFINWCESKGYNNDNVTEDKVLYFLSDVKNRQPYKRGRKRKLSLIEEEENGDQGSNDANLSYSTYEGYINAIVNLWKKQHIAGRFPPNYPEPRRTSAMSSFLKVIKKEVVERENITFKDRGAGTMVDKI